MSMKINFSTAKFQDQLQALTSDMHKATRPAAQAGVQVIYDRAKQLAPVSKVAHYFQIEGRKYGPYQPGNLRDSIYQVYSKSKSFSDVTTYEVSWNAKKAPYGFAYEFGNSQKSAKSFIGRAVSETRQEVREAIKLRYISELSK